MSNTISKPAYYLNLSNEAGLMIAFCIGIGLFFLLGDSYAQSPIRFTTNNGLPSNHVYCVRQDKDGFMWFATNRGIVKYNGTSFRTFTLKDGLPNNDVWLLETDTKGRVWYVSKSNYQGYIYKDQVYRFPTEDSIVLSPGFVRNCEDTVWYSNYKLEDSLLIPQDWKETPGFWTKATKKFAFNRNEVQFSQKTTANELLIALKDRILIIDGQCQKVMDVEHSCKLSWQKGMGHSAYRGLYSDSIYFYCLKEGILLLNSKWNKLKFYSYQELIQQAAGDRISFQYKEGEIQICLSNYLIILNNQLELKKRIEYPKTENYRGYKDTNGNLWLASLSNGVLLLPHQGGNKTYFEGKSVAKIGSVKEVITAGVLGYGFYEIDQDTCALRHKIDGFSGSYYQIKEDALSKCGYLVMNKKLFKIKHQKGKMIEQELESRFNWRDIVEFKGSEYIISHGGVYYRTLGQLEWNCLEEKLGLLLFQQHKNQLYIGGVDGLWMLKGFSLERHQQTDPLLHISISSMATYQSYLLVGTDGRGVYLLDGEKVIHLKRTDELTIQKILVKNDTIWLATQEGVKVVKLKNDKLSESAIVDAFYREDGLWSDNVNDIYLKDSFLYAASDLGLAKINWLKQSESIPFYLYFTTLADTLIVNPQAERLVTINFNVLDYINQRHYNYAYRILPIQKEWVPTESKQLSFSNLAAGCYELEIRATNQHQKEDRRKQYILVKPSWWEQTEFKLAIGGLSLLLIGVFLKIFKEIIRKNEEKRLAIERRIITVELQALRAQMNPHFIHNSLNSILYYIQKNEVELSEKYLIKFSKLIRAFFKYSREQNVSLKNEIELLTNYLEIEQLRFEEQLVFFIDIDEKIDLEEQMIPSMILQPIVENAINHGLFHKKGKGKVQIVFKFVDAAAFDVLIEDNGVGVAFFKEKYRNNKLGNKVNSTFVLEERLDLLRQNNEWEIQYAMVDLSTISEQTGTRVTLNFNQKN
ncbi:sensor histidine kinase [Aureispira anguillae]|uniref:Histidine kinase n=1 Tax=Aureispira anguillae TaxID=2864201 RepID=A0A915YFW1_9BACT|nr:histidine kinase [Aureispira anguillae]BDS12292.1 histidine kinase [Aureispira anguillae]